jgi:hypothetical protein
MKTITKVLLLTVVLVLMIFSFAIGTAFGYFVPPTTLLPSKCPTTSIKTSAKSLCDNSDTKIKGKFKLVTTDSYTDTFSVYVDEAPCDSEIKEYCDIKYKGKISLFDNLRKKRLPITGEVDLSSSVFVDDTNAYFISDGSEDGSYQGYMILEVNNGADNPHGIVGSSKLYIVNLLKQTVTKVNTTIETNNVSAKTYVFVDGGLVFNERYPEIANRDWGNATGISYIDFATMKVTRLFKADTLTDYRLVGESFMGRDYIEKVYVKNESDWVKAFGDGENKPEIKTEIMTVDLSTHIDN